MLFHKSNVYSWYIDVSVAIVTNIVSSIVSEYVPWGTGYRVTQLQEQVEIDKKRLEELDKKFDRSEVIQKGILDKIDSLSQRIYANTMQIAQITDAIPHMIWTGAYIQNMILDAGYRLEEVIQAYKKGQAATHDMSMLWNLTAFKDINAEDTSVQEVTRKSQATVFMKIAVKNKSKDTQVYEVFA